MTAAPLWKTTFIWTATFTCPDGYTYYAPDGFPFATFRKNWRDEWELNFFHRTESCAMEAICKLQNEQIPAALRSLNAA
jgi:hypothetical protein